MSRRPGVLPGGARAIARCSVNDGWVSNQSPFAGRTAQAFPTLPKGDVLGTYDSYPDAQRVVAKLAEADFPVNQLSIVGNDL
ncbi:general stress protein, partial [Mycobacteroides abscessus]|uniref:general stress protein n=1 Tax=Mycobacteroides abscessus TaxID=36809 RepID=UPI00373FC755